MRALTVLAVLLYLYGTAVCSDNDQPPISTKTGEIIGTHTTAPSGKPLTTYFGIPYAQPPVGDLRFQAPVPIDHFNEVFHANQKPCPCYQHITPKLEKILVQLNAMIPRPWCEDCLKLNIWVPDPAPTNSPVLVFLHGGGFQMGTSIHWFADGENLATEENVIVVSLNYRLGVFGFLKLAHHDTPGNQGLLDQQVALKWIHENIEAFGGDPNLITLYGVSAGGASVGFHLLSPGSQGLFKRGILMSGVPNNVWAIREIEDLTKTSSNFAKSASCPNETVDLVLECLRSFSAEEIDDVIKHEETYDPAHIFGPTVDGHFISEHPAVSVEASRFPDVDLIIGSTSDEGKSFSLYGSMGRADIQDGSISMDVLENVIKLATPGYSSISREAIKTAYVDWRNPDDPHMIREKLAKIMGDYLFICGANSFADRYSRTGSHVYRYIFDQNLQRFDWGGSDHGTDMPHFSGATSSAPGIVADFSKRMMKHLANFARTGDPNVDDPSQPKWPLYSFGKRKYMRLAFNSSVGNNFQVQECALWDSLIPKLRLYHDSC